MSGTFNGYHVWLGIPPNEQPPNHYRLLGIAGFETDLDVIDHAADRQMAHVRTFQSGQHGALSQQILNELSAARLCLLTPEKKAAYDEQLRLDAQHCANGGRGSPGKSPARGASGRRGGSGRGDSDRGSYSASQWHSAGQACRRSHAPSRGHQWHQHGPTRWQ